MANINLDTNLTEERVSRDFLALAQSINIVQRLVSKLGCRSNPHFLALAHGKVLASLSEKIQVHNLFDHHLYDMKFIRHILVKVMNLKYGSVL